MKYNEWIKPRSHYKRHLATKRHDPNNFNGELAISGDTSDSDCWWPDRVCQATSQSSVSSNFMQMKRDFQNRQPIGKKTVELTWLFSSRR